MSHENSFVKQASRKPANFKIKREDGIYWILVSKFKKERIITIQEMLFLKEKGVVIEND